MIPETHGNSPPTILVVDDSRLNRDVVKEAISVDLECRIYLAAGGEEALELVHTVRPDLVLLDVNMPGMDGYTVCRAIRASEESRETPVIFVTGQRDSDFIIKGFEAGGSDYLLKPYEIRELMARIRVHLELKLQRDVLKQRNRELEATIARVKKLEGIIPICMYCKKIRSDDAMWQRFEQYVGEHLDAQFSHGVCPDCYSEQVRKLESE